MSIDVDKPELGTLMPNNVQFLIPLYQRTYEWEMKHWKVLWGDLVSAYTRRKTNPSYTHFFGPVVTINFAPLIPQLVTQQHLVDGQQRLTTVTILAKALFDVLGEDASTDYRNALRSLFSNSTENLTHKAKVMPGRNDRPGYLAVMGIAPSEGLPETQFDRAYRFFCNRAVEWQNELPLTGRSEEIHLLFMTLTQGFRLVQIGLGPNESCYEIFDSLNSKGTELSPADEVRNYCFMLLAIRNESAVQNTYDNFWYPMEQQMTPPGATGGIAQNLSAFLCAWGTMRLGEQFAERHLAAYLSSRVVEQRAKAIAVIARGVNSEPVPQEQAEAAEEFVKEVHGYSSSFRRMRWSQTISDPGELSVRSRLERAQSFGVAGAADPLVLLLINRYAAQPGRMDGFMKCLQILESYTVRRTLSGILGKQNNRVFAGLAHRLYDLGRQEGETSMTNLAIELQDLLLAIPNDSDDRWPTDPEVRDGMRTARLYKNCRSLVKDFLVTVEGNLPGHTQTTFASYEVEHIMPKTLTDEWVQDLGSTSGDLHDRMKNTIGNLVLLTREEQMAAGQKRLNDKKAVYAGSALLTTKLICSYDSWGETQIHERSDWLQQRVRQLWPRPVTI